MGQNDTILPFLSPFLRHHTDDTEKKSQRMTRMNTKKMVYNIYIDDSLLRI